MELLNLRSNCFVILWMITLVSCTNAHQKNLFQTLDPPTYLPPLRICGLNDYNTNNLTIWPRSWSFTTETFCLQTQNISKSCYFEFGFCGPLAAYQGSNTSCDGASVCQIDSNGSTRGKLYATGTYNATLPQFVPSTFNYKRPVGFIAPFSNGVTITDIKTNETKQVSTLILFECDDKVPWIVNASLNPTPVPKLIEVVWDEHDFNYWIYVKYAGACMAVVPIDPQTKDVIYISIGSVIVIIAVCSLTLYCTVGFIAKTYKGKSGMEAIPNDSTWRQLPGYTKDGVVFALTCCRSHRQPLSSSGYTEQKEGYDSI